MNADWWMARAIELARRALGTTRPNPAVGAVVVRDDVVLGEGFTSAAGGPHAEPVAISQARTSGHDLRGATLYVTLEPCGHQGRTPPCVDAIIAAGIQRVVVGIVDPFPPMRGQSLDRLRAGGVEVELGVLAEACGRTNLGFRRAVSVGLPEVTAKVAMSLDGNIATHSGESKWISGEAARSHAHQLRAEHDAVLVGIRTLLADDPALTCRLEGARNQPVPVILDTMLRISEDAAVFRHPERPIVVCAEDAPARALRAEIIRVPRDGRLALEPALRALVSRGFHRVLVEGGAEVHRSFIEAHLVDTLVVYVAGVLLPGGQPWIGGTALERLEDAQRFGAPEVETIGKDVVLTYAIPRGAESRSWLAPKAIL